jgi:hypothetical protein
MRKYVKSMDQYGYKIGMNFNKNGQEYKTFFGGIITTTINSVLVAFAFYKAYHMFQHEYNTTGT